MSNSEILDDILRRAIDRRHIHICGEISTEVSTEIVGLLTQWEETPDPTPIKIYINTFGGQLSSAFAIADIVENNKLPVVTYGIGQVFSAGFIILLSGIKRYLYPNTDLMFHNFSTSIDSTKQKDLYNLISYRELTSKKIIEYLKRKTRLPDIYYKRMFDNQEDVYMTPEEALKYGVVDDIIKFDIGSVSKKKKK